jgi:hypothetical protein
MPSAECSSPTTKTKHERLSGAAPLARLQALDDLDVEAGLHRRRRARPVTILRRGKLDPRQHRLTWRRLATTTAACGRFAAASARRVHGRSGRGKEPVRQVPSRQLRQRKRARGWQLARLSSWTSSGSVVRAFRLCCLSSESRSAGSLAVEVAEGCFCTGPGESLNGETDGGCVVCELSVAGGQDRLVDLADGVGGGLALGSKRRLD